MSFFKSLSSIGISREDLISLKDEDIIRIEKKLIAEHRLNESLSKNDINLVIELLRKELATLQIICQYDYLYGILTGHEFEYVDHFKRHSPEEWTQLRHVVSYGLREEMVSYINSKCADNNWNSLRVLLMYKKFLTTDLIELMVQKLEAKFDAALVILEQEPSHWILRKEVSYLRKADFYMLLGELDKGYFVKHLYSILNYIADHENYTKHTIFFDGVIDKMRNIDVSDYRLQFVISNAMSKYGGQQWILYAFLVGLATFFFGTLMYLHSVTSEPAPKVNKWERERDNYQGNNMYWREDQRIQMENFVEARMYSINNPAASRQAEQVHPYRYDNPFATPLFESTNAVIKHKEQNIGIVNHTARECVVIAYFDRYFDETTLKYKSTRPESRMLVHAIYIPAHDSITIDFKMTLLRFYMGNRLASFNTYRRYVYPDSTDVKFSTFTPADSMLFSRAFVFHHQDNPERKQQDLIITQPTFQSYQISWTGKVPLDQLYYSQRPLANQRPDSATRSKPLVLRLEKTKVANNNDEAPEIRTFIYP